MKRLANLDFFGKDAEFHHVGIAVTSIDQAVNDMQKVDDPIQRVSLAFVNVNNFAVELVEPLSKSSPVTKILEKGQSLYHICFQVENIQLAIARGRKNGFHCISKPVPAKAFGGKRIVWLFSRTYGLVELLEK